MKIKEMEKALDQTVLVERIRKIRGIYSKLSVKQKKYASAFNVSCESGCGKCCEVFNPDITEAEAEFLAFGLIVENRADEVLGMLSQASGSHCPLYRFEDMEHHCSVYKWRPLVCRLFGFSASADKNGRPVFKGCRFKANNCAVSTEILQSHPESLVIMGDFGLKMEQLNEGNPETEPVQTALPRAIAKIRYMLQLEREAEKESL